MHGQENVNASLAFSALNFLYFRMFGHVTTEVVNRL